MEIVTEEWRDVEGYKGTYQVSNLGRVKRLAKTIVDTSGRTYNQPEKVLGTAKKSQRYPMVDLYLNNQRKNTRVHRLVAHAFLGDPGDLVVNHKNGNRFDNRVSNLEYVTQGENIQHAYDIGLRQPRTA